MGAEKIQKMADQDILEGAVAQAVEVFDACTYVEVKDRFEEIESGTRDAFIWASHEEKVTQEDMLQQIAQPMVPVPRLPKSILNK